MLQSNKVKVFVLKVNMCLTICIHVDIFIHVVLLKL